MTIELIPPATETSAAQEAREHRLSILQGLHGAWTEYPTDNGDSIYRFVLQDADDEKGF